MEKTDGTAGKLILVVEDDEDMNELICSILAQAGYRTESAFNGAQALDKTAAVSPDLILLDIMLPDKDGVEVCRDIMSREDTGAPPVIMVTVRKELSSKLSSYIAGAKRFISKPFRVEDLVQEVETTMRQRMIPPSRETIIDPRD